MVEPPPASGYEFLPHPADAVVRAWGPTPAAAIARAAQALTATMVDVPADATPEHTVSLAVEGTDWADSLQRLLSELLFWFEQDGRVSLRTRVVEAAPTRIAAEVDTVAFDPERTPFRGEVKAITYHQLSLGPTGGGWEARVVFDL